MPSHAGFNSSRGRSSQRAKVWWAADWAQQTGRAWTPQTRARTSILSASSGGSRHLPSLRNPHGEPCPDLWVALCAALRVANCSHVVPLQQAARAHVSEAQD